MYGSLIFSVYSSSAQPTSNPYLPLTRTYIVYINVSYLLKNFDIAKNESNLNLKLFRKLFGKIKKSYRQKNLKICGLNAKRLNTKTLERT